MLTCVKTSLHDQSNAHAHTFIHLRAPMLFVARTVEMHLDVCCSQRPCTVPVELDQVLFLCITDFTIDGGGEE